MDRYPYTKPPRRWPAMPSRLGVRFWEPIRRYQQIRQHRILHIDVQGLEHVAAAIDAGYGVLVTPNHSSHGDCFLLLDALARLKPDFYFMTAWQVFALARPVVRLAYRHHGCFSVDRETSDLTAYREAVRILSKTSCPLVVFPEGDVYHLGEHLLPPRDGTFMMAMTAVRRARRPVACVPCALRYRYLEDPTAELLKVAESIEQRLNITTGQSLPLSERTERLTEATIVWRESLYLNGTTEGPLEDRLESLQETVLARGEGHLGLYCGNLSLPERVKQLRKELISREQEGVPSQDDRAIYDSIMEDAFVATQLYSYLPGYVRERPTIERIAETIDKLEEDVLGFATARIRGTRRGTIRFDEPILVHEPGDRTAAQQLGQRVHERMQQIVYPLTSLEETLNS